MKTNLYIPRSYRNECANSRFIQFTVRQKESDLFISAHRDLTSQAESVLTVLRQQLEEYIEYDQEFLFSLKPVAVSTGAPAIIKEMARAARLANVGPMAAVAGALSEYIGRYLNQFSTEVIVENGGDIFMITKKPVTVAIYAGHSPLSMRLGIELKPYPRGLGIATSSGTVGHSLSMGSADAVTVLAKSAALADAAATAIGNMVRSERDIPAALDTVRKIRGIIGLVVIIGERIGVVGKDLKIVPFAY